MKFENKLFFPLALSIILFLVIILTFVFITTKKTSIKPSITEFSSSSISSKEIQPVEKKKIQTKKEKTLPYIAEIVESFDTDSIQINGKDEKPQKGKKFYSTTELAISEGKILITNKTSSIFLNGNTSVVIDTNYLKIKNGEARVKGKLKLMLGSKELQLDGESKIKALENGEMQIILYEGNGNFISKENTNSFLIKKGEGIIVEKTGRVEIFKLPSPPEEIKVRVY